MPRGQTDSEQRYSNKIAVNLVHAALGAVSPNFERISFKVTSGSICVLFELHEKSEADLDEIEDVIFVFEALMLGESEGRDVTYEVRTGAAPLCLEDGSRAVFAMRRS